jgi:multidrug resistance protein
MAIAVFIVMLGVGIVSPILPLYAESFRVSYTLVGVVVAAFGIARIIFDIPGGTLGDMLGRRPMLIIGLFIFAGAGLLAAYASTIFDLILARFIQGVGAAFFATTANAYVGDIAPKDQLGNYVAHFQGAFFLGTATGPAIGGFLQEAGGFRLPFIALSLLSIASGLVSILLTKETLAKKERSAASGADLRKTLGGMIRQRDILVVLFSNFVIFATSTGTRLTAIPLYSEKIAGYTPAEIGGIISVISLFNLLILLRSGALMDRYGGRPLLMYGFLISAPVLIGFSYTVQLPVFLGLAALYGLSTGIVNPAQAGTVIEMADRRHRGLFLGVFRVFGDVGLTIGPLIVGILADYFGLAVPFLALALLSLVMAGLASRMSRKNREVKLNGGLRAQTRL